MSLYDYAYFQVSVKAILKKDDRILLLETPDGYYDFPGGRIDESEIDMNMHDVLNREISEELGDELNFKIKHLIFTSRRHYNKGNTDYRLIVLYYLAEYVDGDIKLSDEHATSRWIYPSDILDAPDKFMSNDEYEQYRNFVTNSS